VNYKEALELQKIWQIKKSKVLVGHLYLYNPAYQKLKKLFKRIRKMKSIHFVYLSSPIRKDISVIWDWGPHPISMLLDLIKQPPVEVTAFGSIKNPQSKLLDTANVSIKFNNDIEASIHISWQGFRRVRRLTVEAENGRIEFDDTNTANQKILFSKPNTPPHYPKYKPGLALTEELKEFAKAIKDSNNITSDINMGVSVVKVLFAIEQSVKNNGKLIKLG
ncbi:MAG: hypothetical protein Q8Q86_00545, partial [Candidatus Daviesbacteria bacterium]|nr:hypothetical protein [Candidatus Daviesbacteria bacterium]